MSSPRRIYATLPALGTIPIDFHKESSVLWDYLGDREARRLRDVPHLGVAASVFTGINHSRLEYTLLQCAVIGQIAKLHKDEERLGLAGSVKLNGAKSKVSSAEELLKCWALLSNYGHAQFTYGVERTFLQYARTDKTFSRWLTSTTRHADLNRWCRTIVDEYRDERAHFLLCLKRLSCESPYDRRKTAFVHYIRNLVLPVPELFPDSNVERYKMGRLRSLYRSVRLLSMVTVDSYYSGHPFRLQLGAAVNGLAGLGRFDGSPDTFEQTVEATAAWLADELYLHPLAAAAQREYEVRASEKLQSRFAKARRSPDLTARFIREVLNDGLGRPQPETFRHLLRLTFHKPRHRLLGRNNLYVTLMELQAEICRPPSTYLSVDRNRFSGAAHVDFFYRWADATPGDVAEVFIKVRQWLTRAVEAEALGVVRNYFPGGVRRKEDSARTEELRRRFLQRLLLQDEGLLQRIFWAVVGYVLPQGWSARVSEFLPDSGRHPISARVTDSTGVVYDFVGPRLLAQIEAGPPATPKDRVQELKAIDRVVTNSTAPLLLSCTEKFIIRDQYGKHRDDWDGVVVEITDVGLWLTVVEAKNHRNPTTNETEAFRQLEATRDLVRQTHTLPYRRQRIARLGAKIRFQIC